MLLVIPWKSKVLIMVATRNTWTSFLVLSSSKGDDHGSFYNKNIFHFWLFSSVSTYFALLRKHLHSWIKQVLLQYVFFAMSAYRHLKPKKAINFVNAVCNLLQVYWCMYVTLVAMTNISCFDCVNVARVFWILVYLGRVTLECCRMLNIKHYYMLQSSICAIMLSSLTAPNFLDYACSLDLYVHEVGLSSHLEAWI